MIIFFFFVFSHTHTHQKKILIYFDRDAVLKGKKKLNKKKQSHIQTNVSNNNSKYNNRYSEMKWIYLIYYKHSRHNRWRFIFRRSVSRPGPTNVMNKTHIKLAKSINYTLLSFTYTKFFMNKFESIQTARERELHTKKYENHRSKSEKYKKIEN